MGGFYLSCSKHNEDKENDNEDKSKLTMFEVSKTRKTAFSNVGLN